MVLGKLPVPGRPTIWITVGQGPTALAVGAGGGCLDIFSLIYPFFPLSPSLWETARYRLKYCLKGLLNPKPTNQNLLVMVYFRFLLLYFRYYICLWRSNPEITRCILGFTPTPTIGGLFQNSLAQFQALHQPVEV